MALMRFADACAVVEIADVPGDLFPPDEKMALAYYRRLSKVLHPDVHTGNSTADRAAEAFKNLAILWDRYNGGGGSKTLVIATKRRSYALCPDPAYRGEVANLYRCVYQGEDDEEVAWLKMCRDPKDNEMVAREALVLRRLQADGDEEFRYGAPAVVEAFKHRDPSKANRQCIVREMDPGLVTLADVHRAYPDGLDPRDVAWMWRRILAVLGWAHQVGVVHGSVLPEHVLIEPIKHRLMLVGWGHSVEMAGRLTSIVGGQRDWYPDEVLKKEPAGAHTDIYMATRCMEYLLPNPTPLPFKAFARGCTFLRPDDAWGLKAEFDDLIARLWGSRTYRPLSMPTVGTS